MAYEGGARDVDLSTTSQQLSSSISKTAFDLKALIAAVGDTSNATKKLTADQRVGLQVQSMINDNFAIFVTKMSQAELALTGSSEKANQLKKELLDSKEAMTGLVDAIVSGKEPIRSTTDKVRDFFKELLLGQRTLGVMAAEFGAKIEDATLAARKGSFGVLPTGVYGTGAGLDVEGKIARGTIAPLIEMGLSATEVQKRLQEGAVAGTQIPGAIGEVADRVRASRIAEVVYNVNADTAKSFYELVTMKMGMSVRGAAEDLSKLMQDTKRTGLSTQAYAATMDAVLNSTAVFGSSLEGLQNVVALLAPDLKNQHIQIGDVVSALTNLRNASAGTQMGMVALGQALGTAGGFSGLSP